MAIAELNGTELFYVTIGQGLPCLVMHGGLGFDHTYLHPWLDPLGDVLELIYYDHRGNGRSGRPPKESMTHEMFAADAAALASRLGHERVAVIGHSYGGFIGLEFALRHPERVSHLILLDTRADANFGEEIMVNARRLGATDEVMAIIAEEWTSDEQMRERFAIIWPIYFKHYDPELGRRLLADSIVSVAGNAREGELAAFNATPRLAEIQVPALVMAGRDDWICPPSQAQILHDGLPNSELVIFEESGHLPFIEEPELFFSTVRDWIRRMT